MAKEYSEVKHFQPKFKKWILSEKWDSIAEMLSDDYINIITKIMNAQKDGDCSWAIWKMADTVLDRIRELSKKVK